MRFPQSIIDEIKQRLTVSAVVGRKVQLKKAGREWRGLSPFNSEKTPSFYVNDAKAAWFDFSSGKNGNVFTFLMETEGLTFPEAVERLAADAGVRLPKPDRQRSEQQERIYRQSKSALDEASGFFCENLPRNNMAMAYLDQRDIEITTAKKWGLGFALDRRDGLFGHLRHEGLSVDAIKASGLVIHGDDIPTPYDRFRCRLMFPIHDVRGRLVSFGGRKLSKEGDAAKYINGPETEIFDKGRTLFGLNQAADAIRKAGVAVVGEGYLDVIKPHQAGFRHIVAPMGTALQESHLHALWRLAPLIVVCFDGDRAGRNAAARAMTTALPMTANDRRIAFAEMPNGMDADDVIGASGRAGLDKVQASAIPLLDMIWRTAMAADDGTPEGRAAGVAEAKRLIDEIGDGEVRKAYHQDLSSRIAPRRARNAPRIDLPAPGGISPAEAAIVLGALLWPSYADQADEEFGALPLVSPMAVSLRDRMVSGRLDEETADRAKALLREHVPQPWPDFIQREDFPGWRESLSMRAEAARRRARRPKR